MWMFSSKMKGKCPLDFTLCMSLDSNVNVCEETKDLHTEQIAHNLNDCDVFIGGVYCLNQKYRIGFNGILTHKVETQSGKAEETKIVIFTSHQLELHKNGI